MTTPVRVHREAERGPRQHEPDQRRRVRARAGDTRAGPPGRNVSIERDVWPALIGKGLYGYPSHSYWLDIGTPERYLQGTFDIIEGNVETSFSQRIGTATWRSTTPPTPPAGHPAGRARARACASSGGPRWAAWSCSATTSAIGSGTTIERAVVLNGSDIGEGCTLRDCILAAGLPVGTHTQITGGSVLGEGVTVGAENMIAHGARIFPGVTLPDGALKF